VTINIQLEPQIETSLLMRARARGMSLDDYVRSLIEGAAAEQQSPPMTIAEYETALDELSEGSDNLPVLPAIVDTREGIYGNC
jgi:hypothetical protein